MCGFGCFFKTLGNIESIFHPILVQLMKNMSDLFLVLIWRLGTNSGSFDDFNKMEKQCDLWKSVLQICFKINTCGNIETQWNVMCVRQKSNYFCNYLNYVDLKYIKLFNKIWHCNNYSKKLFPFTANIFTLCPLDIDRIYYIL